ncbi:DUF7289 family protein [Haloferax prahovense]|uniref:DUF7289 family protein n=1 Tax=Haloferax prahovense TaxID=381852 RepID=UPI003C78BABE
MSDRAVSDTLGFVFVFAIVLSMVGLVSAVGMTGLQDARDVERVNNAERALDILGDNMEDIADRGAPSRATEVKLQDASLTLDRPVEFVVSGELTTNSSVNFTNTYEVSPVVYAADSSDERVVYVFDALLRTRGDSGTFVRRPSFVLTQERVLIPAFVTRPDEEATTSVGGSGTFLIRADKAASDVLAARTDGQYDVNLTVRSPRAALWREELSSRPDVTCDPVEPAATPDGYPSVSCYVNGAKRVYAVSTSVDMTFAD